MNININIYKLQNKTNHQEDVQVPDPKIL